MRIDTFLFRTDPQHRPLQSEVEPRHLHLRHVCLYHRLCLADLFSLPLLSTRRATLERLLAAGQQARFLVLDRIAEHLSVAVGVFLDEYLPTPSHRGTSDGHLYAGTGLRDRMGAGASGMVPSALRLTDAPRKLDPPDVARRVAHPLSQCLIALAERLNRG